MIVDDLYQNRELRVYKNYSPTLRSERFGLKVITDKEFDLTHSPYVNKKYKEFYDKNGYIPEIFNPYNCCELSDYAPTLTAQGDSITKSGTVLIICENNE